MKAHGDTIRSAPRAGDTLECAHLLYREVRVALVFECGGKSAHERRQASANGHPQRHEYYYICETCLLLDVENTLYELQVVSSSKLFSCKILRDAWRHQSECDKPGRNSLESADRACQEIRKVLGR